MGESGSNPSPEKDLSSALPSPSEEKLTEVCPHVLVVEDNESDVFLIQEALDSAKLHVALHIVNDGEQAVRFFDQVDADPKTPCPALIILDINLPRKQGSDVLRYMRHSPRCGKALVIAISTSDSRSDREQMKNLGANTYFHKPSEYDEFMKLGDMVKHLLATPAPVLE